jgi:hypothetical protein
MEFMTHVPGVAVHHNDKRFRLLRPPEGIELNLTKGESLPALGKSGKGLDVIPAGEVLVVAKEDRRPERGIVIEIVVSRSQTVKCLGIDMVEILRSINTMRTICPRRSTVTLASGDRGISSMWPLSLASLPKHGI